VRGCLVVAGSMVKSPARTWPFEAEGQGSGGGWRGRLVRRRRGLTLAVLGFAALFPAACGNHHQPSDARLARLESQLDEQLPPGTSFARVTFFLDTQGYKYSAEEGGKRVVAIIQRVDPQTLTRVNARVEFQFDAAGELLSLEVTPWPFAR